MKLLCWHRPNVSEKKTCQVTKDGIIKFIITRQNVTFNVLFRQSSCTAALVQTTFRSILCRILKTRLKIIPHQLRLTKSVWRCPSLQRPRTPELSVDEIINFGIITVVTMILVWKKRNTQPDRKKHNATGKYTSFSFLFYIIDMILPIALIGYSPIFRHSHADKYLHAKRTCKSKNPYAPIKKHSLCNHTEFIRRQ